MSGTPVCTTHLGMLESDARRRGMRVTTGDQPDHTLGAVVCFACARDGGHPLSPDRWSHDGRLVQSNGWALHTVTGEAAL